MIKLIRIFEVLSTLGIASEHYGPMLSSFILGKLPPGIKLLITKTFGT